VTASDRLPRVLCVDDEPNVLESLRDSLRRHFEVVVTTNGFEALRLLVEAPFDVVLTDMRMPMLDGARFLTLARDDAPDTVRLLLTGQATLEDAVVAVNEGGIFRLLTKPIGRDDLVAALQAAVAHRRGAVGRKDADSRALQGTISALRAIAAAADPGAARTERVRLLALELAAAAGVSARLDDLAHACDLVGLGAVSLSAETRAHVTRGLRLGHAQIEEIERLPELAEPFVRPIPQLAGVAALLGEAARPFVPTTPGVAGTAPGARVLRIALDFELLERQDVPPSSAVGTLRARTGRHDPALLDALARVVNA
jgi:CheY-like chemotaxis protein